MRVGVLVVLVIGAVAGAARAAQTAGLLASAELGPLVPGIDVTAHVIAPAEIDVTLASGELAAAMVGRPEVIGPWAAHPMTVLLSEGSGTGVLDVATPDGTTSLLVSAVDVGG